MSSPHLLVEPLAGPPDATVTVPGSKSLTNRALICAAMAEGASLLRGALVADDTEAMVAAMRSLGAEIDTTGPDWLVTGTGGALPDGHLTVDARLSGTTARFLAPILATGPGSYRLDAAGPMRARPMGPTFDALRSIGARIEATGGEFLPATIAGRAEGGEVALSGDVSSQFLSGLLLAGPLFARGIQATLTTALVSEPYVAMTRSVMASFGIEAPATTVDPGRYASADFGIEPDASAASYFFAAAAITGGRVRVAGLARPSLQGDLEFVDVLAAMGATVESDGRSTTVIGPPRGKLRGVTVDLGEMSDTAQTLAAIAPFASSPTTVTGIGFIRRKETDRLANTVAELRRCGIAATEDHDGFTIQPGMPGPAVVQTYDDHRMAMSFAVMGLVAAGIEIADPGCVAKTYPGFFADLEQLRR